MNIYKLTVASIVLVGLSSSAGFAACNDAEARDRFKTPAGEVLDAKKEAVIPENPNDECLSGVSGIDFGSIGDFNPFSLEGLFAGLMDQVCATATNAANGVTGGIGNAGNSLINAPVDAGNGAIGNTEGAINNGGAGAVDAITSPITTPINGAVGDVNIGVGGAQGDATGIVNGILGQ